LNMYSKIVEETVELVNKRLEENRKAVK